MANEKFHFDSITQQKAIEQLQHALHFGDMLVCLVGTAGVGKSSISSKLEHADKTLLSITAHPLLSEADLVKQFKSQAQLITVGDQHQDDFTSFNLLIDSIKPQMQFVLIVDDAHQLDTDILHAIFRFVELQRQQGFLSCAVVLVGEPLLTEQIRKIKQKHLPQANYQRIKLTGITASEMPAYIQQYYQFKGFPFNEKFSQQQYDSLVLECQGNFNQLNRLLDKLVGNQSAKKSESTVKPITTDYEKKISALYDDLEDEHSWLMPAVIVLSILAFVAYWYVSYQKKQPEVPALSAPALSEATKKQVEPSIEASQQITETVNIAKPSSKDNQGVTNETQIGLEAGATDSGDQETTKVNASDTVSNASLETEIVDSQVQKPSAELTDNEPKASIQVPEPESNETPDITNELSEIPIAQPISYLYDEAQLLKATESAYTIQLLVASETKNINEFINKYRQLDLYRYQSVRNQKQVVFIIHGIYADKQQAIQQANKLKVTYPRLNTWVKPIAAVHQDIKLLEH